MTFLEIQILFPHVCTLVARERRRPGRRVLTDPDLSGPCAVCLYVERRGIRVEDLPLLAKAAREGRLAS